MQLTSILYLPSATIRFIREARDELRKVSWPSRELTLRYTIIVVIACLITGAATGGIDYLLTLLIEKII
jgi:preprotein translocase subunit SecE